ncbi:THUMP domain-containing protein [Candidatus Binatia bacterium]|nr:THUMP domain-containing protein [Candidatus Binatia bacterium]
MIGDRPGGTSEEAPWNVLVTAQEGAGRDLKRLVKRFGTFRASGFRNVIVGHVAAVPEFCRALDAELERRPYARAWLGKVRPIQHTLPVDVATFAADVEAILATMADQIGERSFHVRVERRGHKRVLSTRDLELRLGEYMWNALEARGCHPTVAFDDPDVVVAIEIAGDVAGISMIFRELRGEFPFVKID